MNARIYDYIDCDTNSLIRCSESSWPFNVLGIDLGTNKIAFCELGLWHMKALGVDLSVFKSHKDRRELVRDYLSLFSPDAVVFEAVRLFHQNFINVDTIKRLGSLTYLVVDYFDKPCYEIDTRSWKKLILGSAKSSKEDAIACVGEKYDVKTKDNNLADAICIAESFFHDFNKLRRID